MNQSSNIKNESTPPWLADDFSALAPRFTGGLSFFSSFVIVYLIYKSDIKLSTIYHRLMLAMSISDMIASFAMALTTLPMPAEAEPHYPWLADRHGTRLGNLGTCYTQGFLSTFGTACAFGFNGSLCTYYACVLAFRMNEKTISKWVQPYLLVLPLLYGIGMAVPPLFWKSYNPTKWEAWCSPVNAPGTIYSKMPYDVATVTGISIVILYLVIIISFALIIARFIHTVIIIKRATHHHAATSNNTNQSTPGGIASIKDRQQKQLKLVSNANNNTQIIIIQALAYISSLTLSLSPPFLRFLFQVEQSQYLLIRIQIVLLPLQGFFNMLIFIGHKIYNYRRIHPDVSRYDVLCKLFKGKADDNVLLSRISMISIKAGGGKLEVEVRNERDDVDYMSIELTSSQNLNAMSGGIAIANHGDDGKNLSLEDEENKSHNEYFGYSKNLASGHFCNDIASAVPSEDFVGGSSLHLMDNDTRNILFGQMDSNSKGDENISFSNSEGGLSGFSSKGLSGFSGLSSIPSLQSSLNPKNINRRSTRTGTAPIHKVKDSNEDGQLRHVSIGNSDKSKKEIFTNEDQRYDNNNENQDSFDDNSFTNVQEESTNEEQSARSGLFNVSKTGSAPQNIEDLFERRHNQVMKRLWSVQKRHNNR